MLFAIMPVEESQPYQVGRTPPPGRAAQPRTAHQRRSAVPGMCTAPTFPGAWTLRGTIDYPKLTLNDLLQRYERSCFLIDICFIYIFL
jgi:hypothetical protein